MPTHRPAVHVLLCLLLVAVAATLGACGQPAAQPTPTPITIRFAFRTNVANYVALAEAFHQKYPHITVHLVTSSSMQGQNPAQTLGLTMSLTLLKMQAVDIFRDTMPYAPGASLKNELLPLDEYLTKNKDVPRADFLPGLLDTMKIDGVQVGVPAGLNPIVAYYDARRLAAAGATAPSPNWTIDDFLNIAIAANHQIGDPTRNSDYVIGYCSDSQGIDPVVVTYLMGGQLVDNLQNPTRATLNSEANVRAMEWYVSLRTKHKVMPDVGLLGDAARRGVYEAIRSGRCGVWFGFFGDMRGKSWGTLWLGDPVMMPLPRSQAIFNAAAVDGYFIPRSSPHPREAWLWLMFLVEHEQAAGVHVPPRTSQIQSDAFAGRVTPDVAAVARALPATTITSLGSAQSLGALAELYLGAVAQTLQGTTDVRTALTIAQQKAAPLFGQ